MRFRHELIRALVRHFAERAGYEGRIRIFTRREGFDRLCRGRKAEPLTSGERRSFAITLRGRVPAVWVAPEHHRNIGELANTAAHEAVHLVDTAISCEGRTKPEFDRRVRALLRGGTFR